MNLAPLMDLHEFLRTCKTKMMKDIKVDSELVYFIDYLGFCLYATIYNDGENLICSIWDSVGTYQFIEFKQSDMPIIKSTQFDVFVLNIFKVLKEKI